MLKKVNIDYRINVNSDRVTIRSSSINFMPDIPKPINDLKWLTIWNPQTS